MAAVKSVNLLKRHSDTDLIYKIVSWNQADVDKYLNENGILGCGPALAANSIDGKAFLSLNYQSLSGWAIPIIKRSKIVALLNDLGPESFRKDAIVKAHISLKLQHAISNIAISQKPITSKSPVQQMIPSTTTKPEQLRLGPIIPPKPQGLGKSRRPIPPIRNFPKVVNNGESGENTLKTSSENVFVDNGENGSNANSDSDNKDESDYLVPIPGGALPNEDSLPEPIDSRINSFSSERGTPVLLISSDSFTETDDEGNDDSLFYAKSSTSPVKKKKLRKPGFIRNLLFSKTNHSEEKGPQADPFGTPPLPPVRNQNLFHYSSDSNISLSGSESRQTPPPPVLKHRKISSQSATSMSSLAESLPSPSYPPPPVPNTPRRITPFRRTSSPTTRDPSPFFGSQTLPLPSPQSQGTSPAQSPHISNNSTNSETPDGYPWFFNADRHIAESLLRTSNDGTFLIRPSKHGGESASFTLSLQYNKRVFHVLIRKRPDGKLALGCEKADENTFSTLSELVEYHFYEAMQLHSKNQLAGMTRLIDWPENIL